MYLVLPYCVIVVLKIYTLPYIIQCSVCYLLCSVFTIQALTNVFVSLLALGYIPIGRPKSHTQMYTTTRDETIWIITVLHIAF